MFCEKKIPHKFTTLISHRLPIGITSIMETSPDYGCMLRPLLFVCV